MPHVFWDSLLGQINLLRSTEWLSELRRYRVTQKGFDKKRVNFQFYFIQYIGLVCCVCFRYVYNINFFMGLLKGLEDTLRTIILRFI